MVSANAFMPRCLLRIGAWSSTGDPPPLRLRSKGGSPVPVVHERQAARVWLSKPEKAALVARAQPFDITSAKHIVDRFGPAFLLELQLLDGARVFRLEVG